MEVNKIEYHGFNFYYQVFESNKRELEPIFVVNGAFQSLDSLKNIFDFFIKKTTVIFVDLPGTGTADYLPEEYDLEFLCDSIYEVLKELSINKVYLVAASYGTPIAYKFAQKYSKMLSKLVLIGTMKKIPKHADTDYSNSIILAEKGDIDAFTKLILKILFNTNLAINNKINNFELTKGLLERQLMRLDELSIKKYISNTKRLLNICPSEFNPPPQTPTLIITGEYDPLTPPDLCREFARGLTNSIFTTIKGADHLCHFEQPNAMIDILYRFGMGLDLKTIDSCNDIEYSKSNI